jgi:hypothetical protein
VDTLDTEPALDLYEYLDTLECDGVTAYCQQNIPVLFLEDRPALLLDLLYYWEDTCGIAESITRTLVLGAIWDRAFSEDLYGDEIMDFLIWYQDPLRTRPPGDEVDEDWASGGVASAADFGPYQADFDAFTRSVADQLLPHTAEDTPERFFCLFYSGRTAAAWRLLAGDALRGTYLKRQYEWELERISLERKPANIFFSVGYWKPEGNLALAGNHAQLGMFIEKRPGRWMGRAGLELLLGRARCPYVVDQPDGRGRSDRFNVLTLVLEGGYTVLHKGAHSVDLFLGGGLDWLSPFHEEDAPTEVVLLNFKGLVGAGYRWQWGRNKEWFAGFAGRREWMGERNDEGTPLDGEAWNFRLSIGYNRNHELDRRLRGLGR